MNSIFDRQGRATCAVCGRQARGFGWTPDPNYRKTNRKYYWLCSTACADVAARGINLMDLNKLEKEALWDGIRKAGQHLDNQVGQTDLAKLSKEQMVEFAEKLLAGYGESMKVKIGSEAPF